MASVHEANYKLEKISQYDECFFPIAPSLKKWETLSKCRDLCNMKIIGRALLCLCVCGSDTLGMCVDSFAKLFRLTTMWAHSLRARAKHLMQFNWNHNNCYTSSVASLPCIWLQRRCVCLLNFEQIDSKLRKHSQILPLAVLHIHLMGCALPF